MDVFGDIDDRLSESPSAHNFQFPLEGSYLSETENGIPTSLLNEKTLDPEDTEVTLVRILKNFFIVDAVTRDLVSLSCLWESNEPCEAFGFAVADADEDEDEVDAREFEPDDGIFFRTSTILTYSLDIYRDSIWVRTQYSWYILGAPASIYSALFLPFYRKEMLLRLVLRCILKDRKTTEADFLLELASPEAKDPLLGRCWNKSDFLSCQYTLTELSDIVVAIPEPKIDWNSIKKAPLIVLLQEPFNAEDDILSEHSATPPPSRLPLRPVQIVPPPRKRKQKQKKPVKEASSTITPTVNALIASLFDCTFTIVGESPLFLKEELLVREQPQTQPFKSTTKYKPGDFVIVYEGDITEVSDSDIRFAQILFFDSRRKNFHARWFIHGSKTILEELSHGQELFLSIADGCQDISSDCIISKCKVKRISLDEHAREQWPAKDSYFYSSAWDRKHPAGFIEVTDEQVLVSPRTCQLCEAREAPLSTFKSSIRSTIRSREYHKYDFIRYEASSQLELTCSIGQIIGFICSEEAVKVQVHKLGRERERKGPGYFAERALFLTSVKETVEAISVIGTCQVIHISEYELKDCAWIENHPDCFYVQSQATSLDSPLTPLPSMNLKMCHSCYHEEEHMHELKVQCYSEQKLRAFDPFIGIGGFGLGLAEGCSMQTVFGVEIDPSAAETTRKNFPLDAVIITDDANRVLRDVAKGREHRLERGKIDFIYSGPPCQNDSTLNRHKTDQKRPVFTTLSFVDVIRPAFFIMESVPGFLQWKLHRDTYDIQAGELKLCLKILHFLGYNVSSQIMHARSFGVPQTRDRFFIVATQPIWGQFQFPEPTHAFNEQQQPKGRNFRLGQGLKVSTNVARGRALHELVTVAETLSDLPQFDWKSPKKLTTEDKKRAERFLTVTCRSDGLWGIDDVDFQYVTPSVNAYQWRLRKNLILSTDISYQHYTKHLPMNQVENICDVPFSRGADYRHLNQEKRDWSLRGPTSAKAMAGFQGGAYTRLNPDGYFQTVVTNVGPVAKQSQILHPFCKRIITVREYARAQGFPDDFTFYSVTDNVDEYYRQIGNSIPFGVSAALGCSIQDLVFKNWLKKRRAVNEI